MGDAVVEGGVPGGGVKLQGVFAEGLHGCARGAAVEMIILLRFVSSWILGEGSVNGKAYRPESTVKTICDVWCSLTVMVRDLRDVSLNFIFGQVRMEKG